MRAGRRTAKALALAVTGLLIVAGAGALMLRSGPLAPVEVTTVRAGVGEVVPGLFGIGTVEARRAYMIGPIAAGRVLTVHVDVGDRVRAGQLLAEMDPVDLGERIVAIEASIARARSTLAAGEAQLVDAQARRRLASVNTDRYVALADRAFVSPAAVDARRQEQASADAGVSAAQANLEAMRQDVARLAADRAGLLEQRRKLALVSPVDGLVTAREAEAGSTVVAGQAVVRTVDPASLWVRVRLDQARSAGLEPGLPARIALRSSPDRPVDGRLARIEPIGDSITEERLAYVRFAAPPAGVPIGEVAEVTIELPPAGGQLVLPNASIRQADRVTGVWRVGADGLGFVPVRVGARGLDGRVQVLDGLAEGDEVVVHSSRALDARTRIAVREQLVMPPVAEAGS